MIVITPFKIFLMLALFTLMFLVLKTDRENNKLKNQLADSENAKILDWYIQENKSLEGTIASRDELYDERFKKLTVIIAKLSKDKNYDIDKLIKELKEIR